MPRIKGCDFQRQPGHRISGWAVVNPDGDPLVFIAVNAEGEYRVIDVSDVYDWKVLD
jgi:hypothetical protein